MTAPTLQMNLIKTGKQFILPILNAGIDVTNEAQNKRTRIINISSFIAAALVFFFGIPLTILSNNTAILIPAVPEMLMFTGVVCLNYFRQYFLAALLWHLTFCLATLIFGVMLSSVIDATHMAGYLIGAPLLIFNRKETRLIVACISGSMLSLIGIEVSTQLSLFTPLAISEDLYPIFRVATWTTVILLNVVVILFYLYQNNILINKLELSNAHLNEANATLAKVSAYKTIYVNETTHELRSPLNALNAIGNLLQDDSISDENRRQMYDSMNYAVNHALGIINNVLESAKIEAGESFVPTVETVNIMSWAEGIVRTFSYQASKRNVTIHSTFDFLPHQQVNFAKVQVTQILNNLLSNAIKFTVPGSVIQLIFGSSDQLWFIEVIDEGPGMDDNTLERIFLPYFSEGGKDNPYGTGLGMHISKKIAEKLGGRLIAFSSPGNGSRFRVTLPIYQTADIDSTVKAPALLTNSAARVLVIDDDVMSAYYMGQILTKMGCEVITAQTGRSGIALAEGHHLDIVFMDINLPDFRGRELLALFTRHPKLSHIPVVLVSGSMQEAERHQPGQSEEVAFVLKPVRIEALNQIMAHFSPTE